MELSVSFVSFGTEKSGLGWPVLTWAVESQCGSVEESPLWGRWATLPGWRQAGPTASTNGWLIQHQVLENRAFNVFFLLAWFQGLKHIAFKSEEIF